MTRLADKLKDPPWDRLSPDQKAPYLRDARECLQSDVYREQHSDVAPEEFEDAVRQAAEETYAEICEEMAIRRQQASKPQHIVASPESGNRISP
jgi:hypothetical protein